MAYHVTFLLFEIFIISLCQASHWSYWRRIGRTLIEDNVFVYILLRSLNRYSLLNIDVVGNWEIAYYSNYNSYYNYNYNYNEAVAKCADDGPWNIVEFHEDGSDWKQVSFLSNFDSLLCFKN